MINSQLFLSDTKENLIDVLLKEIDRMERAQKVVIKLGTNTKARNAMREQ